MHKLGHTFVTALLTLVSNFMFPNVFYSKKQYNPKVILIAFIASVGSVFGIGIVSHREIKKRMYSSEPESII